MPYLPKESTARTPDWQKAMQSAFRRLDALLVYLNLDPSQAPEKLRSDPDFPILVTREFAANMVQEDWQDPLLLQILPLAKEDDPVPGFTSDAVGDLPAQKVQGLLHKYSSRALLMVSHQCAIHCRYCFRREFPYGDLPRGQAAWDEAWEYLRQTLDINEIIFSGGDPLFLDNGKIANLLNQALALPQIKTIRFHTRLPVVLPSRIDRGLLDLYQTAAAEKSLVVVIHANHPREISDSCGHALAGLKSSGALLLNQTVLLKGVNDQASTLAELSWKLIGKGVLPYYLHQLDRVQGAAHFEIAEKRGLELMAELRSMLPGYAVPKYVREVAGEAQKTPII